MRKAPFAVLLLFAVTAAVYAAYSIPLGHAEWTPNVVTALTDAPDSGAAMPDGTSSALICVESQPIRFRTDGVNPTSSVGTLLLAGQCVGYTQEPFVLRRWKFLETSSGAKVTADFYGN